MESFPRRTVTIIGGGAGGCCTALALAKTGLYHINLLEKNTELMRESSDATPGRMGLGFHYADKSTALYYLHATLEFTKAFGSFRQEKGNCLSHPLRRGRYFILKDSIVPKTDILETFDSLKAEYERLVREDASYELFGPPEQFYRILESHEFENDIAAEEVDIAVETAEELLDWPRLRRFIVEELESIRAENIITLKINTEVLQISEREEHGYVVSTMDTAGRDANLVTRISTDVVVNASWYNIGKFNKMLGLSGKKRCNRIKAIATISLPEDLVNKPSMFFCMGPFGMFSNKGNGIGMITYAPETNIAASTSEELEPELANIYFNSSEEEKRFKGQRIIDGVSKYIPAMRNANLIKVEYGIIQTFLDTDSVDFGFKIGDLGFIHDPVLGGIYRRNYSGVEAPRPGYIVNACIKLLYCFDNATLVSDILKNESQACQISG